MRITTPHTCAWRRPLAVGVLAAFAASAGADTTNTSLDNTPAPETTAATELPPLTVTSEKRERKLQDVPSSISVVTPDDLELSGGKSLVDATSLTPNVIVQNQGGRTSTYFYTRGIGRSELNFPIVSVNVNGVALPDPAFFGLDLDAAEQVEFLRGPQGTLYGQNTLGGVINIRLQEPGDEASGSVEVLAGERDYGEVALRFEGPLAGDKVRAAGTLLWNDIDGYIDNPTRDETQNPEQTLGGSLFVVADPTDHLRLELNYFGQDRDDGLPQYAQGEDPFEIVNNARTEETVRSDVYGFKAAYDLGSGTLESQTGWVMGNRFTRNDTDFTAFPLMESTADVDIKQWSQEIRYLSNDDGPMDYVLGLYGSGLSNDFDVFIHDFGGIAGFGMPATINDLVKFDDLTLAAFGQLNWRIDRWELVAGLRYHSQEVETDNTNSVTSLPTEGESVVLMPATTLDAKHDFDAWLPRVAATYALNEELKLYGSASRGFRAGGFNNTALTAARLGIDLPTDYDPEYTWNYEIGAKWRLPNGLGRVDVAAFVIDWPDMQSEQIAPDTLIDYRTNAASATSTGAEIELRLFPHPHWELGGSYGYAKAEFDDFIDAATGADLEGNQVPGGAKTTWNLFAKYDHRHAFGPVGLKGNIAANGVKGRMFDAKNLVPGDDYSILNARLGLTWKTMETFVFVRNALDEEYIEFEFPGFGRAVNEPRLVGIGFKAVW